MLGHSVITKEHWNPVSILTLPIKIRCNWSPGQANFDPLYAGEGCPVFSHHGHVTIGQCGQLLIDNTYMWFIVTSAISLCFRLVTLNGQRLYVQYSSPKNKISQHHHSLWYTPFHWEHNSMSHLNQGTSMQSLVVLPPVKIQTKQDVIADSSGEDPGLLWYKAHLGLCVPKAPQLLELSGDCQEEGGFATSSWPSHSYQVALNWNFPWESLSYIFLMQTFSYWGNRYGYLGDLTWFKGSRFKLKFNSTLTYKGEHDWNTLSITNRNF